MNIAEIESQLKTLAEAPFDPATFPFSLLEIFDAPKATITKLRQGSANQAAKSGDLLRKDAQYDLLWKKKLFFRVASPGQAAAAVEAMAADPLRKRHEPRFLLATDGNEVYCVDTKLDQSMDVTFGSLNDRFDFFLPLAGVERYEAVAENPADIKATGRLAKLYDAILEHDPSWAERTHELNLFMTRVLFCFFAEDTGIFEQGLFTYTVMNFTNDDGSGTVPLLTALFAAMDTPTENRGDLPDYVRRFPYVNGGLFADRTPVPGFNKRARRLLRDCGELKWQEINPDIFGSMIQAVVEPGMRGDMGMHYTSVPNIMKVLQPLFLLSLEEELAAAWESEAKLRKLLDRLYTIRVFDPACGSGNFLIIAYRELRRLENKVFARLNEVSREPKLPMTGIKLSHFYGIELADFAVETARLSLWIAEYQMNEQFKGMFGTAPPILPLKDSGNIVHGNSTRLDWEKVCPKGEGLEIYIVGNPPYLGGKKLSNSQSSDMDAAGLGDMKQLDYIGCWFIKAADYIENTEIQFAFVTTSSVSQGEQVHLLWPYIFDKNLDIFFAYEPFKWSNNAKDNAGVTCSVIGIKAQNVKRDKWIFSGTHGRAVKGISPYLIEGGNLCVAPSSTPINGLPSMCMGSNPVDGTHLVLTENEYLGLMQTHPEAQKFTRRYMGGDDFVNGGVRYCLWIGDDEVQDALAFPFIQKRVNECREYRLGAGRDAKKVASKAYRFCYRAHQESQAIIYPNTGCESRKYIPGGFTDENTVINHAAFAIYNPEPYLLGILSSTLHRVWLGTVGGRFKNDPRSVKLVYNTFPVPVLSSEQKTALEDHAWDIIAKREGYPGKTIAWLYDPKTMPADLLKAHRDLDETLETIYIGRSFRNDTERQDHLFRLYALMIKKQAVAPAKKTTLATQGAA